MADSYQAWNREEKLERGSDQNDLPNPTHPNSTFFSPMNHHRTPLPNLSPLNPLPSVLDSEFSHDDPLPETFAKVSKSQNSLAVSGRVVSLARVWEHEAQEDVYSNKASAEPFPKRKKTTVLQRSQSLKNPVTSTVTREIYENDTVNQGEPPKQQASQLTTPPDSSRRKPSNVRFGASRSKDRQTPAFKNLTIIKPSPAPEKSIVAPPPNSIISLQGWRSTEDSVKSTPIILAKTTMEKLASFRFKPPSDSQPADAPRSLFHHGTSEMTPPSLLHKSLHEASPVKPHFYNPSKNSLFEEALWPVKAHSQVTLTDQIQARPAPKLAPTCAVSGKSLQQRMQSGSFSMVKSTIGIPSIVISREGFSAGYDVHFSEDFEAPREDNANSYDPTSSEAPALDALAVVESNVGKSTQATNAHEEDLDATPNLSIHYEKIASSSHITSGELHNAVDHPLSACSPDRAHDLDSPGLADYSLDHHRTLDIHYDEACRILSIHQNAKLISPDDNCRKLRQEELLVTTQHVEGTHETNLQVKRSDLDEHEMTSKKAFRSLWGSDEFDQGSDDDDLLAIVSNNATVLQSSENYPPAQQKNSKVCGRFLLPRTTAFAETHAYEPSTLQNHTSDSITALNFSHTREVFDIDDHFPMDEEEEEEMLQLSEIRGSMQARLEPSESVQKFFNNIVDGEVCDSSLHFSPPKSQSSCASPSKVACNQFTNKSRTLQTPSIVEDSLSLCKEEDWSFIRLKDPREVYTMSEPLCDPPTAPTRPPQPQSTSAAGLSARDQTFQTVAPEKTADTFWSMIEDSRDYEPMQPFARPDFPALVLDRSPVVGLSPQTCLRTCFRIGEMFKEGARCASVGQDAVIELFARVKCSSREAGSTKQYFQFADLWHDRPPYPNGLLANYRTTAVAEGESKVFLSENGKMARCLGRFTRDWKNHAWQLYIINIRETDWEEIRWTKLIVGHA